MSESVTFTKNGVSLGEYNMLTYVTNVAGSVKTPCIISYDRVKQCMIMERISGMSVADFYGEDISGVPKHVLKQIREIILTLYQNNIIYPDITGYNFIQDDDGLIWIIDFEHAYFYFEGGVNYDPFIRDFICGLQDLNSWNPDFK